MSLSIDMIFHNWKSHAQAKGWKIPTGSDPFPMQTWINYWLDCEEYERDPGKGRPVIPHRSGGGQHA